MSRAKKKEKYLNKLLIGIKQPSIKFYQVKYTQTKKEENTHLLDVTKPKKKNHISG